MIEDLKVGDKVYIREDLKDGEFYGSVSWLEGKMKAGISTISAILSLYEHGICISDDIGYFYDAKMIDWEKTRELNAKDNPTFDDLIDVAVQAVKDKVLFTMSIGDNRRKGRYLNYTVSGNSPSESFYENNGCYQSAINFINSLYTETFVIESEEDMRKMRIESKGVLPNGLEFKVTDTAVKMFDGENDLAITVNFNGMDHNELLYLSPLKGVTVTQKRGK